MRHERVVWCKVAYEVEYDNRNIHWYFGVKGPYIVKIVYCGYFKQ